MWVLNEMIKKIRLENLKKSGAVWELPANRTANPAHFHLNLAGNSQTAPTIFFKFLGCIF